DRCEGARLIRERKRFEVELTVERAAEPAIGCRELVTGLSDPQHLAAVVGIHRGDPAAFLPLDEYSTPIGRGIQDRRSRGVVVAAVDVTRAVDPPVFTVATPSGVRIRGTHVGPPEL